MSEKPNAIDWQFYRQHLSYEEQTQAAYAFIRKAAKDLAGDGDQLVLADGLEAAAEHLEAHERYLRGCIALRNARQ